MALIYRSTFDMFEFAPVMDYQVNPCNLMGVAGAGLSLEFRTRVPDFIEKYKDACRSHELRVGTIQIIEDTKQPWGMINLPTKRHYMDTSSPDDIKRGLIALRETLQKDFYRYAAVGLPMLGCGLGKQDYSVVLPMMQECLEDLEACVFISMSPERTDLKPRYLLIAGPPTFGKTPEEHEVIDNAIDKALSQWDIDISEYTGIICGGMEGVDAYIGGTTFNKDIENTYVFKKTGKSALVIKPNHARNGVGANLYHNNLLCEIADDIILFKPQNHNNNRLSAMQVWINNDKDKRLDERDEPRRLGISGDKTIDLVPNSLLVPVTAYGEEDGLEIKESDIPY